MEEKYEVDNRKQTGTQPSLQPPFICIRHNVIGYLQHVRLAHLQGTATDGSSDLVMGRAGDAERFAKLSTIMNVKYLWFKQEC